MYLQKSLKLDHEDFVETQSAAPGDTTLTPEAAHLLEQWNPTAISYPEADCCLHELFEAQAQRTPESCALVFEGERLSYGELNRRAGALAGRLQQSGAGPDSMVGICVERSLEMIVGILGILKAGAAYVPIDTAFPQERIAFVLSDAKISLLLTQTNLLPDLPLDGLPSICLDSFDWNDGTTGVPSKTRSENLAYVIYTSGSTGQPKGVGIEHRNIVNYVLGIVDRFELQPGMSYATVSTIAADLGNTVVFPSLVTGGCLHVISQARAENSAMLGDYFERESIDVLKIVPSHLAALQAGRNPERVMPRMRLILGGEASRLEWITRLRALMPACQIHNHYGPTETTVGVLTYRVGAELPVTLSGTLPLGRPLANSRIYVVDEHGQPAEVGVPGELCIAGRGVARGYLNRAELTAERFVADPLGSAGERMYRTGDRARHLPDGNIEFLGRIDQQVKIRGYRIEPGEIESALLEQGGVREAVVIAREDEPGNKNLVAYVVPQQAKQPLWETKSVHILPDGAPVAHLNKNETDYIYHEIFELQAYIRHGVTIRDGDCILDAGSNIGMFTVFASRLARNLRICCFEPNPAAFACLSANAAAWGADVKCFPCGVSRENGSAEMTFFEGFSLLSGFYADEATEREVVKNYALNQQAEEGVEQTDAEISELLQDRFHAKSVKAELRTLGSVIAEQKIGHVDLLKVNVEKSELDVLQGLGPEDWPKIRQMVIEVDQKQSVEPIVQLLEQHGYETLVEQDPLLRKTDLCYVYAIRPSAQGRLIREQGAIEHVRVVPPPSNRVLTPVTLRKYLSASLPHYMIPSAFVRLEKLPLTLNGKLDRNALPAPSYEGASTTQEFVAPRTQAEKGLAGIWTEVLKVERIGINDDFFELGGHSLLAIKAVSRIRDVFEVDLPTRTFFANSTIAGLARIVAGAKGAEPSAGRIGPRKLTGPSPLSFAQERLWFFDELAPESPVYNILDVVRVPGMSAEVIRRAVNEIVRRHEALRTVFSAGENGQPVQIVLPAIKLEMPELDLSSLPKPEQEREWVRVAREEGRKPFDLTQAPLLRVTLVRLNPEEHLLLVSLHHIIIDEWSMEVFRQELKQIGEAYTQGKPSPLPELPIQYADFASWQRIQLQGEEVQQQIAYWKQELAGAPAMLELPTDKARPAVQTFRGATEPFDLSKALLEQVKQLGRQEQATLFMTLSAGFMALLQRYSRQDDVVIGTPISGRTRSEMEGLIGFFLNTVALRARFNEEVSFRELLGQVRERTLGAFAHQDLPFEQLVAELAPKRDLSHSPLFQVMFILNNPGPEMQAMHVNAARYADTGTAKFDLTLSLIETEDGLAGSIEYSTDLFEAETIQRLSQHYGKLMEAAVQAPDQSIATLAMLPAEERQRLLTEWNQTAVTYPDGNRCLPELFAGQAARTPNEVAVAFGQEQMTYAELDARANQLAGHLKGLGVGRDVLVGLLVERSAEMMVALLGVLKAGGGYVPLDPAFPRERLGYMVEDSGMRVMLTHRGLEQELGIGTEVVVRLDTDWAEIGKQSKAAVEFDAGPENLAYVLYTSGSTGKPKGVEIPHCALVNFLQSMKEEPGFKANDRLLAVTTLSFDIAGLELYLPLVNGGRVIIASRDDVYDPARLMGLMKASECTVMQATPATWRALVDAGWQGDRKLKVLCGGEALPVDLVEKLLPRCSELWNMYGPTETTIWSTVHRVRKAESPVAIGRPIANTQVYLLDGHRDLVAQGTVGELYIGGTGLARGYLKRPELTAERFIASPFAAKERLYRTGDLARWQPNGILECLGRVDNQVKIRGFRIELGEIETVLGRHEGIGLCAVVAREEAGGGEKQLVAYFEEQGKGVADLAALRAYLQQDLPHYMIPAAFVRLEKLPLTPNGKIDRKALPAPAYEGVSTEREYVAPTTATEKELASIWSEVLKVERIGINDDFFELGGHSLLAIKAVSRIRDAFEVDLPTRTFFANSTIAGLARIVAGANGAEPSARRIEPRKLTGPSPLSFAEERLWFLDQLAPGRPVYNVLDVVRVTGMSAEVIRRAVNEIVRRHEALRTVFSAGENGQPVQIVLPAIKLEMPELDLSSLPKPEQEREWVRVAREEGQKAFDLTQAPLLRAILVRLAPEEHLLLVNIHHIVADEWSLEIFRQELKQIGEAYAQGRPSPLPELPIQYADFASWQRTQLQGEELQQQIAYWKQELAGAPAMLELPTDKARPAVQTFRGATEPFDLSKALLEQVKQLGRQEQATLFMTLSAGFMALLQRYSRQDDVVIGTPISGRTRSEMEGLIGFFLNTVALRARFNEEVSFRELLGQVRERTLGAFAHQDLPFEQLVAELAPKRDLSHSPLFQVMFILNDSGADTQDMHVDAARKVDTATSRFDLTLSMMETEDGLAGSIEYSTDLFEAETIQRLSQHYGKLMEAAVQAPDQSIATLAMLPAEERQRLLTEWNQTAVTYPDGNRCLPELFAEQAARTPNEVAVVFGQEQMTYAELDARANQLARHLKGLGVGPDVPVGLLVERSVEMMVALLGVVKAGGGYVPLDPAFPRERLAYMVEDSGMRVMLTHRGLEQELGIKTDVVVRLDTDWAEIGKQSKAAVELAAGPENLAYVLYTSGSTGKPKGVEIPQRALVNLLLSMKDEPGFKASDRLLAVTTLSFDIAELELYLPLISGGRVVIASREDAYDPVRLMGLMEEAECTVMQATPATWRALVDAGWEGRAGLRVQCGGEALQVDLVEKLLARCGELWNMYGPTETTIYSVIHRVTKAEGPIPIGHPIANTQLYLLDGHRNLVAQGAVGELYIGGAGLARGYLGRPELTQERFIASPFEAKARLYRTGDLARWLPGGIMECLGRVDNQVKIRGFRIELGEIETVLGRHEGVGLCAVVAREAGAGEKQLVAYFEEQGGGAGEIAELRAYLQKDLPHYMIPAAFVRLEKLPLTPNGKIDRKALPAPEGLSIAAEREFVAPRDPLEQRLARLWSDVLKTELVGVNDNFFELGGHSLLAVRLMVEIEKAFKQHISLATLLRAATVGELAAVLREGNWQPASTTTVLPQVRVDTEHRYHSFALNNIQQAYIIGRSDGVELGNIACQSYDEVDMEDLDVERFGSALQEMIERHEMLRCVILPEGRQQILRNIPKYEVKVEDLRRLDSATVTARLDAIRKQMTGEACTPEKWPLFEFRVSLLDDRRSRMHVKIDQLIMDGRSYELFFTELMQLYHRPGMVLPALELSFRDYIAGLDALEKTEVFRESRDYWVKRVPSLPASPELPLVKNPAAVATPVFRRRSLRIEAGTWRSLKEIGGRLRLTPSGILLAAFSEMLAVWSKKPQFTVNVTLFNRLPLHPQSNEIIGDFTSVNLLEVDNSNSDAFVQRAQRHQEQLWQDMAYRYFSGIHVMRELTRFQRVGPKAIMPVVFTSLLNLVDSAAQSSGSNWLGRPVYGITGTPQVFLDFMAEQDKGALIVNWDAVDELFADGMLDDMFEGFRSLLLDLAADPASWNRSLWDNAQRMIPAAQLEVRAQANATQASISDELLHTPFLQQVAERPSQLAISTPERRLTYAETYGYACRLEKELLDRGVLPNQMVGILMDKGWEQVVSVLGIHFAGAAYLPIDSELPAERQRYLMEHGETKIVLTQSRLLPRLDIPKDVVVLTVDRLEPLNSVPPVPRRRQKVEDLAYVIYTSGSTGLPKGVMIDHRGALNTVLDVNRRFGVGPQDRVLALSRLNFDLSVYDVFGMLAAGGTIVMPSARSAQDVSHWADLVVKEKVTIWNTVPALMQLMAEEIENRKGIGENLRVVMMSGDWIPVNLPEQIRRQLPHATIMSLGGATEASIWSIWYPIENVDSTWKSIPYGKPMANQTFHVLSQAQTPSPVWVPGQLHIGGIGVAKGYWRDEEKTRASFIQHPVTGERLYRTGDLGRYLPDGNIEFLGREDFQVKVQGYRIELGEITVRLQESPGVDACTVVVRQDNAGEKRLVGYAVPKAGAQLDVSKIQEYLRTKLPHYMVPGVLVILDELPLTPNGKIDHKALPAPTRVGKKAADASTASGDFLETQLTQLWEKVLGVKPVGRQDNFFDLGGTSMMAVRLFSELRKRFGKNLYLPTLFQAPTVEKIAEILRNDGCVPTWSSLVPIQPNGDKPPFYCVHGAGGNVLMFRELAERMAPDFPFYGMQAQGLDDSKEYLKTVEEMAVHYLEEIKQFQPEGPYYLGGFCLGGQVAFHMAQILRERGEKVALLAMIDTYNFHGHRLEFSLLGNLSVARQKFTFHLLNSGQTQPEAAGEVPA